MASLKKITDLPVAEYTEGLNLIVNDNGAAKQVAAAAVGVKSYNDLEDKPCYTEVDNEGNETVHKLDAKYLPDNYDLIIKWSPSSIPTDGSINLEDFSIVAGTYEAVRIKFQTGGQYPTIKIIIQYEEFSDNPNDLRKQVYCGELYPVVEYLYEGGTICMWCDYYFYGEHSGFIVGLNSGGFVNPY